MSVAGVARDLAARLGRPVRRCPSPTSPRSAAPTQPVDPSVEIVDPDLCGRFVARVLDGVRVGPSPRWIADRLAALGHAADQQRRRRLQLRDARAGPAQPHLRPGQGAPAARSGSAGPATARRSPPSTASSARSTARRRRHLRRRRRRRSASPGSWAAPPPRSPTRTTDVLLEMAWWYPMADRPHARRAWACAREASARFERGADPEIVDLAARPLRRAAGPVGRHAWSTGEVDGRRRPARLARPSPCARPGQRRARHRPGGRGDRRPPRGHRLRRRAHRRRSGRRLAPMAVSLALSRHRPASGPT